MAASPPASPIPSLRKWKAHRVFDFNAKNAVTSSWGVDTKNMTIWECPVSGLRFRQSVLDEQLRDFYGSEYHEKMTGGQGASRRSLAYRKENESRVDHLHRYISSGRVLDVGCSHGVFAQAMNRSGLEAFGIDISPQACAISRVLLGGDHVYCGTLEALAPTLRHRFAAVTLMDVIEHCSSAVGLLRAIYYVLEPQGILFLRTPTLSSPFHIAGNLSYWLTFGLYKTALLKLYHAEHLYFFSESSIRSLLNDCGFDALEIAPDPLCWANFRTAELKQGLLGNLLLSGVYFAGRAFGRGHGMKVIARRRTVSGKVDDQR
jgi:2-polyprenyl-3-methyl-5-hydroxy-6-metoxy-1,4-benzoquinol methylase